MTYVAISVLFSNDLGAVQLSSAFFVFGAPWTLNEVFAE
jgi:hypothetical protein